MLLAALDYKQAFTMLEKSNDNYNQSPSAVDWEEVEVACRYLKILYDSAHSIMATEDPTANIFFHEAWTIQIEISSGTDLQDPISSRIAKDMHERFDKYWKDCNVILAIAVVMDPHFKMKIVEFSYSKIYGLKGVKYVKVVDDAVHELYNEYVRQPLPLTLLASTLVHLVVSVSISSRFVFRLGHAHEDTACVFPVHASGRCGLTVASESLGIVCPRSRRRRGDGRDIVAAREARTIAC